MPRRLITVSYTGLNAGGGVPKFNRDLHAAFSDRECLHFSWEDFPWHPSFSDSTEWGRARGLNQYLVASKQVTADDVVVADGFWADGLDHLPFAISHSHGIWSHLTNQDVLAGKQPDMPHHHAAQVNFRHRWVSRKKHLTAVSNFIAEQMRLQWGFVVDRVINNGVDTGVYVPAEIRVARSRPLIIHGVNDPSNENKGWRHIQELHERLDADVLSLDEATERFSLRSDYKWTKPDVLAQADIVVHPSGYEGCSMFIAEALACGVPIVAYDVGYLYDFGINDLKNDCGRVLDLRRRSPSLTLQACRDVLSASDSDIAEMRKWSRNMAPDIKNFVETWRSYVEEIENA